MVGKDYYREKYLLCKNSKEDRINIGKELNLLRKIQTPQPENSA
jgi:hypothetical protein